MGKANKQKEGLNDVTRASTLDVKTNQEYRKEMKPRLLGEQWRERQKK